ncbi:MAG: DUF6288 domain-containing protein [Planctomycetota bacterium]|nr:DUF6288 domain-containing protein [Planctomycetota bacterium]
MPDLTQGGKPDKKHDWNLGPTGARGWIWGRSLETTHARQVLITKVDKGAPADGKLFPGDVILGAGNHPFDGDARRQFGNAITRAEAKDGTLPLIIWRRGEQKDIALRLPALGAYADSAPFSCIKSQRILDAGCRHIAKKLKGGIDGKMNVLALLASGKPEYKSMVKDYARKHGPKDLKLKLSQKSGMASWPWGYTNLFLTEYYLATGDDYVLPAIREYSMKLAQGQSLVGSWGHGMAWPDLNGDKLHGSLGGYGALNQAGLICHLSLVLAAKCGIEDDEVTQAIARANRFFGFYIGKGAIPYGDHRPGWRVHDDNGKNSVAAVIFDLQGNREGTRFFSKMTVASHGERERGHTGNYFSFLWGALGAARAGDDAAAAFLKELRWFYDLQRKWDGSFPYQGGAGMSGSEHKYGNWDCTGSIVLGLCLPLRKLYITGKGIDEENRLEGQALVDVVEAGRDFSSWDLGISNYKEKSHEALLKDLGSWSPAVRHRAASALVSKEGDHMPSLLTLLKGQSTTGRYGACEALGMMKAKSSEAVPALTETLLKGDLWLRIQAAYALSHIGEPAREAAPLMLKLALKEDEEDPREFFQRYLCFCLFYPGGALRMRGLLAGNLNGIDRPLLYSAVRKLLQNDDGRARGAVSTIYKHLTFDEIRPLLPAIHQAIKVPAPSGVMFASGIRMRGLALLAKFNVKEGMELCIDSMAIHKWGKRHRITECLKILGSYGGAAKPVLPKLRELDSKLNAHWEAKGLKPQIDQLRKLISDIEKDQNPKELRSIKFN